VGTVLVLVIAAAGCGGLSAMFAVSSIRFSVIKHKLALSSVNLAFSASMLMLGFALVILAKILLIKMMS
jgi:hypothetical protein